MSIGVSPASLLVIALATIVVVGCGARVTIGELPEATPEGTSDGTNPAPDVDAGKGNTDAAIDTGNGNGPNDAGDAKDSSGTYVPCAGKTCGQQCSLCAPNDPNCVETGVVKFCHPGGECKDFPPACVPPPPYQPCAGKVCGQTCTQCDPTDPNCVETAVLKQCSKTGQCSAGAANCI